MNNVNEYLQIRLQIAVSLLSHGAVSGAEAAVEMADEVLEANLNVDPSEQFFTKKDQTEPEDAPESEAEGT